MLDYINFEFTQNNSDGLILNVSKQHSASRLKDSLHFTQVITMKLYRIENKSHCFMTSLWEWAITKYKRV